MADEITLKGVVSALTEVPESHRSLYTQQGDKFILTEVKIENVDGLKNTAEGLRKQFKEEREKLAAYEGVNLEEWKEYQSNKEKIAADAAKAKGDWDANVKRLQDGHKVALDAKDAEISKRQRALESEMIDSRARAALSAAGGNDLFLLPHVTPSLKIVEENGTFSARVIDPATGEVRVNSATGKPMTIDDRIGELKADAKFAGAFAASGAGGTGSPVNANGGSGGANKKEIKRDAFDRLPAAQKDARMKEGFAVVD